VVIVAVAAVWIGTRRGDEPASTATGGGPAAAMVTETNSIAVLPFVNMSDDASNEYFSDGISEELLNLLAKIPDLRVISRSSAFSYKGKDIKLVDVARELNVAHILEGSVRKAGNRVRITVQLIEAGSDTHLWTETYDRTLDDIFAIQDEIAATVVEQLKVTLLGEAPKVKETNSKAYALYLQARHLGGRHSAEGYEQSNALYEQALAIDPDYAAVWSGLATNYSNQANTGLRPRDEGYRLAREMAQKALAIDPEHAPAHARLGWMAHAYDYDRVAAARHYERALALEPANLVIIQSAATLLQGLGRLDESIALSEYVVARDPVNRRVHHNLGAAYLDAGRWDDAIASFRTELRLSPGTMGVHYGIGTAMLMKGEAQEALEEYAQEEGDEEYRVKGTALALHALGRQQEYEVALAELIERWGEQWLTEVAHVYAWTGNADAAFTWLEKEFEEEGGFDPESMFFYTPLHEDPRWAAFLERAGSSPAQLDAIEFKVTLPGR
jgi:TolB-like protein/Tfp pilus assembly protein PilF